mmetsp:Transcript_58984/g.144663  ORF Transcript_58984/g.144663 Transcript_58984/m.144663 type:complete len:265 (+) Transcript_58984:64-858(+)
MASGDASAGLDPSLAFHNDVLANEMQAVSEHVRRMASTASASSEPPVDPGPAPSDACRACGSTPAKMCAGCRSARYCSEACQRTDWPNHKQLCLEEKEKEKQRRKEAAKIPRPTIEFYYPLEAEDDNDGYTPCVHLESLGDAQSSDLHMLTGASDVVVHVGERSIKVYFCYPFSAPRVLRLRSPSARGGFTRQEFAQAVATTYKEIYEEEERSQTIAPQSAPGMLNRGFSNGSWGIWGHYLWDLHFHSAHYDHESGVYSLGIDS